MTRITKLELEQRLAAALTENEQLRLRVSTLEGEAALKAAAPSTTKPAAPRGGIFEFNPAVKGDFARAAKLAREAGGRVVRMKGAQ